MLEPTQWSEFLGLMRAARGGGIGPQDELRLRWYVAKFAPGVQFRSLTEVYDAGLMAIGLRSIERLVRDDIARGRPKPPAR